MKTGSKTKNGKKAGMSKRERRFFWIGLLFLSPWLIGFLAFSVYPICAAVYYSFTDYSIFTAPKWIGVKNYLDIFADKMIWKSLLNTAYITVVGLPVSIIISLALALLLNQKIKGLPIFRTIFYLPTVVPVVASAMLFMWVLNPEYGILNMALGAFGISGPAWLSDPRFTKLSLILMDVWRCGGTMIIFLSALQSVPPTFYEAADLDGATFWQEIIHITLPCLRPTIVILFLMSLGNIMRGQFDLFYQLVGNVPLVRNTTEIIDTYVFRAATETFDISRGTAVGLYQSVVGLLLVLGSNVLVRKVEPDMALF